MRKYLIELMFPLQNMLSVYLSVCMCVCVCVCSIGVVTQKSNVLITSYFCTLLKTEMQYNWSTSAVQSLWHRCLDNETGVRSAGTWGKNLTSLTINIIVLRIDLIFIYFISDHGISGIMPFKVSIIRNNWTTRRCEPFPLLPRSRALSHLGPPDFTGPTADRENSWPSRRPLRPCMLGWQMIGQVAHWLDRRWKTPITWV